MRPSKFQIGDRVTTNDHAGVIDSIRWDGDDFIYSVHLDVPIVLRYRWVAREFEITRELTYPRVNLNGTGKEQLIEALRGAHQSVIDAIIAVGETAPHGRDYQTLPQGTYERARDDYSTRMAMLRRVRDEILEIAIHVDQQGK